MLICTYDHKLLLQGQKQKDLSLGLALPGRNCTYTNIKTFSTYITHRYILHLRLINNTLQRTEGPR